MEIGFDKAKLLQYKAEIVKHLGNPAKLRLTVVTVLFLAAMVSVYMPFSDRVDKNRSALAAEHNRSKAITDVEALRKEVAAYDERISEHTGANNWVQYMLDGLRAYPVKLRDMESRPPRKVGPYLAVILSMEIEGTYARMKEFVEWLECSDRVRRVDSLRFEKRPKALLMKITVLGLIPKNASAT